jgi:hypothetical protein
VKITFAVTETGLNAAAGDYFTALELGHALTQRFGWVTEYIPEASWYEKNDTDVLVSMLDHFDPRLLANRSAIKTVAWARNWFDSWAERPWLADYDLLLSSSQQGARLISEHANKLCSVFRIATNPERFDFSNKKSIPSLDYVFTGNHWGASRDIVEALSAMPKSLRGAVYGKHWENHALLSHLYKGFVVYDELPSVYAESCLVIDDANHQTKAWGAANSRAFDALAAGCLVITNSQSVSDEVFDGLLPVYQSPEHLNELTNHFIQNTEACESLQAKLRAAVLKQHCYRHRAFELKLKLQKITPTLQGKQ